VLIACRVCIVAVVLLLSERDGDLSGLAKPTQAAYTGRPAQHAQHCPSSARTTKTDLSKAAVVQEVPAAGAVGHPFACRGGGVGAAFEHMRTTRGGWGGDRPAGRSKCNGGGGCFTSRVFEVQLVCVCGGGGLTPSAFKIKKRTGWGFQRKVDGPPRPFTKSQTHPPTYPQLTAVGSA
jgi:hypothetical protein